MTFDLDPEDTRPLYVQIEDHLRREIVLGTWRGGEALPSARELSIQLRVNPNTVRQAYLELERAGVVEGRQGAGTFVQEGVAVVERRRLVSELAARVEREAAGYGLSLREVVGELETRMAGGMREREAG